MQGQEDVVWVLQALPTHPNSPRFGVIGCFLGQEGLLDSVELGADRANVLCHCSLLLNEAHE